MLQMFTFIDASVHDLGQIKGVVSYTWAYMGVIGDFTGLAAWDPHRLNAATIPNRLLRFLCFHL